MFLLDRNTVGRLFVLQQFRPGIDRLQPYWTGPYMWGDSPYIMRDRLNSKRPNPAEKVLDPHLRSTHDVRGHHIHAADGGIGHVDDFIIDDEIWAIRYLIIDTKNWWPGKRSWCHHDGLSGLAGASRNSSPIFPVRRSGRHRNTQRTLYSLGIMKPACIDITTAQDTGSMNRLPRLIPIESHTREGLL